MRGSLTLLSRHPAPEPSRRAVSPTDTPSQQHIPTIRLISATPSAAGTASDANNTFANASFASSSFVSVPPVSSPLAPKPEEPSARRRLVPKKSKLSLLVGSKSAKANNKDLSDVVRRVGGTASAGRSGFEIYVDPTDDPELGEILMVKKKKSRAALDGLKWGPLGETTNIPPAASSSNPLLKVKSEEKDKWWSIGRGRKDSKEKAKAAVRAKSPEPAKAETAEPASRARFNSLDSGILLSTPAAPTALERPPFSSISSAQTLHLPDLVHDDNANSSSDRDEIPTPTFLAPPNPATGSIAIRAMRSMRSMARLTSWSQGKPVEKEAAVPAATVKKKEKEPEKKKKKKEKQKEGRAQQTPRYSGSSFEAGTPISPEVMTFAEAQPRKAGVLGLGLPSTMRFGTARAVSSSSSSHGPPPAFNRLSADSAVMDINGRGRSASTVSTGSSLRPPSTASNVSRASSGSSTSVKWDEEGLQTVKEQRRAEAAATTPAHPKSTRRTSAEARRRAALADIFPEQMSRPVSQSSQASGSSVPMPIVTIEEATADGHSDVPDDVSLVSTPQKRNRVRPMSEQMLVKDRPKGMRDDTEGVLSILDAATNDLASLISRLDLEATPGTPDGSPLRLSPSLTELLANSPQLRDPRLTGSPFKKPAPPVDTPSKGPTLRTSMASVTSLRPYSQSRRQATVSGPQAPPTWSRLGQQIAPWPISPTKNEHMPKRAQTLADQPSVPTFRLTHKRTLSPAPLAEPPVVFLPLRPAKAKTSPTVISSPTASNVPEGRLSTPSTSVVDGVPSSVTFGSRPSKMSSRFIQGDSEEAPSPTPVFRKAVPRLSVDTMGSKRSLRYDSGVPISPEARKGLGLAGTLGGSVGSVDADQVVESDDPDSDVPDELRVILSGQPDVDTDTLSFRPLPSPGMPPELPLPMPEVSESPVSESPIEMYEHPVFRAQVIDDADNHADIDGSEVSDDDTKKSFDFTGELQKLNESGGSDRRSFVEQLESAFRTPAKFDLDGFGQFTPEDAPPVPTLPVHGVDASFVTSNDLSAESSGQYGSSTAAQSSLLPSPEISAPRKARDPAALRDISIPRYNLGKTSTSSKASSQASDGQLNVNFKFGGMPSPEIKEEVRQALTLSDIIPPPAHIRSLSMSSLVEEDSSVLKSIMGHAVPAEEPPSLPRRRVNSDSSAKRQVREQMIIDRSMSSHSRASSQASFTGFDSFDEVRRGFEFSGSRPAFYPPSTFDSRRGHQTQDSMFSIASVSSYGVVLNPGVKDPFDYDKIALPSRPSSDDMSMSMSMSVDDTFDFIRRDSRRKRVDSDASSFYFRSSRPSSILHPIQENHRRQDHRRQDSTMSTTSMAPPISLYNRSHHMHRRNDSVSSAGSVAQAFASFGAAGKRTSWAPRHRQDMSVDSVMSDMSALRVSRPGLGDKMLESARDYGMPLAAISASPPESVASERMGNRTSFDSLMDDDRRISADDSIFEKTGYRTSSEDSGSVFGRDESYAMRSQYAANEFRPLSLLSMDETMDSPKREDDTMITMLDGGHVRRRSVGSIVEGSPCVRVGKRKHATIRGPVDRLAMAEEEAVESPKKTRLIEQPSIASTSSLGFGHDRMISARKGVLARQSLEEHCLSAEGNDLSFRSVPVFSRPRPASANRSRSSTQSSSSSGAETPPLSSGEGSSVSSDSQSSIASIDLSRLNVALANMTHPMTADVRNRIRTRARGHGHRRRVSAARASRSSVYETIQEEMSVTNTPVPERVLPVTNTVGFSAVMDNVIVVEADDANSVDWSDERGIQALRRYTALKDEAHVTVEESKRLWMDTAFSVYAVQSFDPPRHPAGMQALLEHSKQNYGHLAAEIRRMRSRTNSRPSPYPRAVKVSLTSVTPRPEALASPAPPVTLQDRTANPNVTVDISPYIPDKGGKNSFGLPARPRVASNARRSALGWAKRSTGKENKENTSQGSIATPGENLRMSRPRPRARPTPSTARPLSIRA
ncbi:hypothetical protein FA95DRAFT_1580533 [Auriscalpium vulgare]|uniref:Uncharacterized protein n=1 Tax=Auriscalpium vulgare TaxID=40419 RepID=A0ACB8S526_9AGAM|nr:hypothetical protein FA95DRAFT_1580533 [Auriscalpium vulgare]